MLPTSIRQTRRSDCSAQARPHEGGGAEHSPTPEVTGEQRSETQAGALSGWWGEGVQSARPE
jgi:hypothetical protein